MAGAASMLLIMQLASFVLALGSNEPHDHRTTSITTSTDVPFNTSQSDLFDIPSYSGLSGHSGMMVLHICFMVVAWFFVLPVGVAFGVAKSRLTLPANLVFLILNGLGVVVGTIYNITTPDLYEGNAHHSIGWIATWITAIWAVIGMLLLRVDRRKSINPTAAETVAFLPLQLANQTRQSMARRISEPFVGHNGQTSDRSSSCGSCSSSSTDSSHPNGDLMVDELEEHDGKEPEPAHSNPCGLLFARFIKKFFLARLSERSSSRLLRVSKLLVVAVDRTILILGFVALVTGGVTYAGIFRGKHVFNGLAHFIKGGIFFWYGLLTLGRWAGCFADIGWAWNLTPAPPRIRVGQSTVPCPSAEFVESFVIFLYGCTNVFLEHLAAWGSAWTAQDLEHVSISAMFFGGGLAGMLADSSTIRTWLNATAHAYSARNDSIRTLPKMRTISTNPVPALVIFLLGIMMSSHHQRSLTSTKVHKQWGMLLSGFSAMRILTLTVMYISPPTSIYPTRPPFELLSSFFLISGGIIFMASTTDVIHWMEANDLMPMFVFTVAMGLSAFIMAWEILVLSLKGWVIRREADKSTISKRPLS